MNNTNKDQNNQTLTCVRSAFKAQQSYGEFVVDRKNGFGGSDIGDLLNSPPYGCNRRLFLDKINVLPPRDFSHHLERGKFFEGPVSDLYAEKTGREVKRIGLGYLKEFPFIRANADRLTSIPERAGMGVLEIKVPSAWSFKKIKSEGLPEAYILQLQWQMLCYGTEWGSFAVYWPDGHELLWFDVERDHELCMSLFGIAKNNWERLSHFKNDVERGNAWLHSSYLPEPISSDIPACQSCAMFDQCHAGKEKEVGSFILDPEMEPQIARYAALNTQIKGLETERDRLKQELKNEIAKTPVEAIRTHNWQIAIQERSRTGLDTKKLEEELKQRGVLEQYQKKSSYEVFTVKELKK